jgi:hypothetical protein
MEAAMAKKILHSFLCALLFLGINADYICAIEVTATAPQTGIPALDAAIQAQLSGVVNDANAQLEKFGNQTELARGFADANTFTSSIASQRSRPDIAIFAVTLGTMIGAQFPEVDYSGLFYDSGAIDNAFSDLEEEGDIYLGFAWQLWSAHVQINAGFLTEGLTLGLKFGKLSLDDYDDFSFEDFNFGVTAFYRLVETKSLLSLIKWNGITVGSGLIYQSSRTNYNTSLDPVESPAFDPDGPGGIPEGTLVLDPSIEIGLEVSTLSIPLEIYTGVQLLWALNLSIGAGVDLAFGASEIILGAIGDTDLGGGLAGLTTQPGSVDIDGGTSGVGPSFLKPRLLFAIGLSLGPALLEVPFAYYFNYGLNAGISLSFVW